MNDKPICFVSYSRKDLKKVSRICNEFANANIEVWRDKNDIVGGESWKHAIYEGIRKADVLVFLMTPDSVQAQGCLVERCLAEFAHKVVVTVMLEKCTPPTDVQHLHYIDLSVSAGPNMPALISAIHAGAKQAPTANQTQSPGNQGVTLNTSKTSGDDYGIRITGNVDHIGRKETKG